MLQVLGWFSVQTRGGGSNFQTLQWIYEADERDMNFKLEDVV
jgi:hypothetical protein